jgi:hypothetical protein
MTLRAFSAPSEMLRRTMTRRGGEHHKGRNGVRLFCEQLMKALPDFRDRSPARPCHRRRHPLLR